MPTESMVVANPPPLPMVPSRLDVHARLAVMVPSSASVAIPAKLMLVPSTTDVPEGGAVIVTVGAVLTGTAVTVTLMASVPGRLPLSVTDAVMVWVPTDNVVVTKAPPVPRVPSRLEVQTRLAVKIPSSASVAVPAKLTLVPSTTEVPEGGAVIVTVGGVFAGGELPTVNTMVSAVPAVPPLFAEKGVAVRV